MATDVLTLKKQAIAAGMPKDEARRATRSTLEDFLSSTKAPAKKKGAVAKKAAPAKKKTTTRKPAASKPARKSTRKAPAAKSTTRTTGKAKRASSQNGGGRHLIGKLDFSQTDGWNPRKGSPVETIFRTLKKFKGDVEKTTAALLPNAKDFVGLRNSDGSKKTKAEVEKAVRYRVNRTKFQFALQTGQHESSTERVKYGTGDYASRNSKPKRSTRKAPAKAKTRTTAKAKPNTRKAAPAKRKATRRR